MECAVDMVGVYKTLDRIKPWTESIRCGYQLQNVTGTVLQTCFTTSVVAFILPRIG